MSDLIISERKDGDVVATRERIIVRAPVHGRIINNGGSVFVEQGGDVKGKILCGGGNVVIENGGKVKGDIVCMELDIRKGGKHEGKAITK